ncbi:hypothetical protein [Actinoplanes teichomyceticus]|uniref:dTDP-4-amino-4,6-dideoxygalactose transaminase n=1 Tax=Actinoplanes teichomyceticus TaxID=1867 RepID=A0A561WAN3_ACTTI|nr:hypothetical protein [Actinoplanes teichomyceticus]TWG20919.1 hypothetical protein FHX34_103448 [Actinoplanes teichomyceticus]GIF16505.1 hypothetical protein Ate01nite_65370 [Actinoplanes teichomyceticus]
MPSEPAREIGSEFHWDPAGLLGGGCGGLPDWLPERRELFATGCGALRELLRRLAAPGRLHVPSYFCPGVAAALAECLPVTYYRHLPDGRGPRWETLRVRPGDVVLAQNLFGRDDPAPWAGWIAAHPGVPVIEDHSHDPFGGWARRSTAAYALASLRKTLPLPDGALLWSPQGRRLPAPRGPQSAGAAQKLTAMLLKAGWLDGWPVRKEHFRALQRAGESALLGSSGPVSTFTAAVLPVLDVAGIRARGTRNVVALGELLDGCTGRWPAADAAPFRLPWVAATRAQRDALLAHLAAHRIFAPVHWPQNRHGWWSGDHEAAAWADRMLTLPVDHRCSSADVRRIAGVVTGFSGRASRESRDGHIIRA